MAVVITMTGTGRNCTLTNGTSVITSANMAEIVVGATVQGTGIPTGTKVGQISGSNISLVDASGVPVNVTANGVQSMIFSSVWGSRLDVSLTASGDVATMQNIYNAGFGVMSDNLGQRHIFFPGAFGIEWKNIVAGARFDFQNWTIEFGAKGYWAWEQSTILGELRGGYLVNGTQFIKSSGPTFISSDFKNSTAGGSNMFTGTATGTVTGTFRMNDLRVIAQAGVNRCPQFNTGRMFCIVDGMILDYQGDGGPNAGIGASFGTLNNTTIVRANSGIGQPNGTNYATINGLSYSGLFSDSPNHKFSIPNNYVLEGYSPQVLSNQLLGGFQDNTTETYANIDLSTAGWGINDLKTKYQRYGGPNEIRFPRRVSLQFNDSTGVDLTNVTLFIRSGATILVNAVQAGDYSANTQALILNWTGNVASYRLANTITDTIEQFAQIRKNGYISQNVSYSLNTSSYNQPIFLLTDPAYGNVTPTQAAALTGISIDYTNKLVTGSSARNLDQLYAFGQFNQALTTNSAQADYQVSNGGTYNLLNTWRLLWTSGALTMGTYNRTFNGSTQWRFDGTTSSLNFDKNDVVWTPATFADQISFTNGATFNLINNATLTVNPTTNLGYGSPTMFGPNTVLNMSNSSFITNLPSGYAGAMFSANFQANGTTVVNLNNATWSINGTGVSACWLYCYWDTTSTINNWTVNGTAIANTVILLGFRSQKLTGLNYGGTLNGSNAASSQFSQYVLMDNYTYTGAGTTLPMASSQPGTMRWVFVDSAFSNGNVFRWVQNASAGYLGVSYIRPTITIDKPGYTPKMRLRPNNLSSRYPSKIVTTTALSNVNLSNFYQDSSFSLGDGALPFVDSLDNRNIQNFIDWTLDFRQNGWLGQSVVFTAATAKKGSIAYTASGAVDSNYINDTTGAADALLVNVNEVTKVISAATGTLAWSSQRMYNALVNKWSSFVIENNIPEHSTGGSLDLADYTVDDSIQFVRGSVSDLLSQVRTTGIIESQSNEIPVADVNGSRASISGLDPENFGVTWYLRYQKGGQSTWTNSSGIGNNTQIIIEEAIYTIQVRVPGYDWKTVLFDATLSLSLELNLAYHVSANNTPQYTMSFEEDLESLINFDPIENSVSIENTTGTIINPGFAELYQATQRIQHLSYLVWTWSLPITANSTSQKILIPTGNPVSFFLTAASNASVKVTCPVIHASSGQSADDRVKGNASGYSIILGSPATAESAGLQSAIVSDILEKIGGSGYAVGTDSLKKIKDQLDLMKEKVDDLENYNDATLSGKVDAVKAVVDALQNYNDTPTQDKLDLIKAAVDGLSNYNDTLLVGKVDAVKAKVDTLSNYNDTTLIAKVDAIKSVVDSIKTTVEDKTGYALTTSQIELIATTVESHLLDEGDSQKLIEAIVGAIGNANIDETVLVAAIRADLERVGGKLEVIEVSTNNIEMDVPSIIVQLNGKPTLDEIEASTVLAKENTSQAIKNKVNTLEADLGELPTLEQMEDSTVFAKEATLQELAQAQQGTTPASIKEELRPLLAVINNGVKNASKIKTHKTNLPE